METTRERSLANYSEYSKLKNKIKSNLDFVAKYECKHQGEYYISTIIPKAGINYFPTDMPDHVKTEVIKGKEYFYGKEVFTGCKPGQQVNIIIVNWMTKGLEIKAQYKLYDDKNNKSGNHFYWACGKTDISYEYKGCSANCKWHRKSLSLWEKPFSVTYFGPNRHGNGFIRDWTLEFQLQMISHGMALN